MGSDLDKKLDIAVEDMKSSPANDNTSASAVVDNLYLALSSFLNENQVKSLIHKEISDFHCLNRIELSKNGVEQALPDLPRHYLFSEILQTVDLNIPGALIGPAGAGKSTLCEQIATALSLKFYLQNGVTGTHELTGYMDAHGKYVTTPFRQAFQHGGLILVDEVDTSEAAALKWVNTALANGHAGFPDNPDPVLRHKDFRILIAANTYGTGADRIYVGANQLDASTLDRFTFFDFKYDEKLETLLSGNTKWTQRVQSLRRAAGKEKARIVISPRASIMGAKLLSIGWDQRKVEERVVWKGIDKELKERIEKAA